jgi:hypothetical protein
MKQAEHPQALTNELSAAIKDCLYYARSCEPSDINARARCFVASLSGGAARRWPDLGEQLADLLDLPPLSDGAPAPVVAHEHFVTVAARTLPSGLFVPAFQFSKYPCARLGKDLLLAPWAMPWTNITHAEAVAACTAAGYQLSRESQELAIRLEVCEQDINWTGGKVGVGKVFQGLHKGTVSGPQVADYVSADPEERSWHQLANGQRVYGLAGNIYTHVFDDVQGDGRGVVAKKFSASSPSITAAPYPSREKGMGWRPNADANWSGDALLRGGYWNDEDDAGVFVLDGVSPGSRYDNVGFRCTK